MKEQEFTFEEALTRLETIVHDIEEGKIGLEESIRRYEEGMTLLKHCREILSRAELKIQKIQQTTTGSLETGPLLTEPSKDE